MVKIGFGEKMKQKYLTTLSILALALVSACGPAPEPTLTNEEIIETAAAQAWIAITETAAAMPTATETPIPPTATLTPLPTFTFTPFPTIQPLGITNPVGGAPTNNPCYEPPVAEPKGTTVQIKLVNNSKGLVDLSLGMENANTQGECATYFFRLGRYDQPVVTVLAACYWGYAYITDPTSNSRTAAPLCLFETTKTVPVSIGPEVIGLQ